MATNKPFVSLQIQIKPAEGSSNKFGMTFGCQGGKLKAHTLLCIYTFLYHEYLIIICWKYSFSTFEFDFCNSYVVKFLLMKREAYTFLK